MKILSSLALLMLILSPTQAGQLEKKLADIQLNKSNMSVLDRYGNPNDIEIVNIDKNVINLISEYGKIYSTPTQFESVKWIYKFTTHKIEVSYNSNSFVESITISGNTSPHQTLKNIKLGSKYSDVVFKYGNPNYTVEYEDSIVLNFKSNNLSFKISKSKTVPMKYWIVKEISINNQE